MKINQNSLLVKFSVFFIYILLPINISADNKVIPVIVSYLLSDSTEAVTAEVPTITSAITGKVWMDRNLGASHVCTSFDDSACYGDYYQWGRGSDGHEKFDSGLTSTQASDVLDVGHSDFIIGNQGVNYVYDWTDEIDKDGLIRSANWNPCPSNFRIPNKAELDNEKSAINNSTDAFNKLKLPSAGARYDGQIYDASSIGSIWSSSVSSSYSSSLEFSTSSASLSAGFRSVGKNVRCIKDDNSVPIAVSQTIQIALNSVDNIITLHATDTDADILNYELVSIPSNGILNGTLPNVIYTPNTDFTGNDSFSFKVDDGKATSNIATIYIQLRSNLIGHRGYTYGTVTSAYTGKVWLDRNIGASQVCKSFDDALCYGDYYQWGRKADGHEKSNSEVTQVQATDINNAGNKFIDKSDAYENDWTPRYTDDDGQQRATNWLSSNGEYACPVGYRVPTSSEFYAETVNEGVSNKVDAYNNFLRLPSSGLRAITPNSGIVGYQGIYGMVWTSSVIGSAPDSRLLYFDSNQAVISSGDRSVGHAVRCIKN